MHTGYETGLYSVLVCCIFIVQCKQLINIPHKRNLYNLLIPLISIKVITFRIFDMEFHSRFYNTAKDSC